MSTVNLSIGDIVSESWNIVKRNIWIFVGAYLGFMLMILLVFSLMGGIGALTASSTGGYLEDIQKVIFGTSFLTMIMVIMILTIVFSVGYQRMALIAADGQEPTLSAFSVSAKKILNILFAYLLFFIVVEIGFVLCIIPGIILLIRLSLYPYFILDKDCNAFEALSGSWNATQGQTMNIFLLGLAYALAYFVGVLCCFVGVFVAIPMIIVGNALVYRKLTGEVLSPTDFDSLAEPDNI